MLAEPDAAHGFEPKTEAPPKGVQVRRAAAEDDVSMANAFDVAEKGVDAAVDGEAETAGAGAGAWDVWTSEAAGAGAGAAAAAGFAKGFWDVNKAIAVAAGT